jgi:hypothetical protein
MREPERLKRVTFVRLQQRNASWTASRSTVAADKSLLRVLTFDRKFGADSRWPVVVEKLNHRKMVEQTLQ